MLFRSTQSKSVAIDYRCGVITSKSTDTPQLAESSPSECHPSHGRQQSAAIRHECAWPNSGLRPEQPTYLQINRAWVFHRSSIVNVHSTKQQVLKSLGRPSVSQIALFNGTNIRGDIQVLLHHSSYRRRILSTTSEPPLMPSRFQHVLDPV